MRPALLSEAAYAATLAREISLAEPEDALKWERVHPAPESYDFSEGDRVVDFVARHGMRVRGHTLAWHRSESEVADGGKIYFHRAGGISPRPH